MRGAARVNRWVVPVLGAAVFFGGTGVAMLTGSWVTSGRQIVATDRLTPTDLKGWMTLGQASDGLGLPLAEIVELIGPPPGVELTAGTAFKDVEALVPGFDFPALKAALAVRSGSSGEQR